MSRRRRCAAHRNERGAVAVEAALVTPILFIVLIGIIEMSLLMRDVVAATSSVRTGARVASVSAAAGPGGCAGGVDAPPCTPTSSPALAQAAVDAIQRGSSTMPKDAIDNVFVYRANADGYPQPAGNTDVSACEVDCVKFAWAPSIEKFRYVSGSWDSRSINACVNESDAVGIAMTAHHDFVSGLFGASWDFGERAVMKFEPLPTTSCKPGTAQAHP